MSQPDQQQQPKQAVYQQDPQYQIDLQTLKKRQQKLESQKFLTILYKGLDKVDLTNDGDMYQYIKLNMQYKGLKKIGKEIQKYPHLRYINISNLSPLKYLVHIDASKNDIQTIRCLATDSFPNLQSINLSNNKIQQLPLLRLPSIKTLQLSRNKLQSVQQLQGHQSLQILCLRGNIISCLSIKKVPKLKTIFASQNQINKLKMSDLQSLNKLYLRKNQLIQVNLKKLESLSHVNLRENQISKLDMQLPESLRSINLQGNPISDQLADNTRKELTMLFPFVDRVNKQDSSPQDKEQFLKEYKERLAQKQRQRRQKEQAQRQERERLAQQAKQAKQAQGGQDQ